MTRRPARDWMPKGLYTRSLLIVILPMLLLQSVIALVFMERHWQQTSRRLSATLAEDVAAFADLRMAGVTEAVLASAAREMSLTLSLLPGDQLPAPVPTGVFSILERILASEIGAALDRPFWLDARSSRGAIEIQVRLDSEIMRITAPTGRAYASNSHILLVWMVGTAILLISVSILFLRNQIRPILQLASAAEDLGKGREVKDFKARGALEVRRATQAFFAMRDRIERQIEQRTTMLAGVSHDLRTVLTRLRLQLALLPQGEERAGMEADIHEMERMLEGYLAFARGDAGEAARPVDIAALLEGIGADARRSGHEPEIAFSGEPIVTARPDALKRAVGNLVTNAFRFGTSVRVAGEHSSGQLVITVDDDGPGVPPELREDVFRPFLRLDQARNLDHPGSGLGLTIARDVARGHGGDIELSGSPLGGLRARLHIPA